MGDPRDRNVVRPPRVRAGLAALAVPAVLGVLALPGLLVEAPPWPLVLSTVLGFPLVLLAGEDGLAIGVPAAAALWAPIVAAIWWTVGRRVAAGSVRDAAGFTWTGWGRGMAQIAPLVLVVQTIAAVLAAVAIGPVLLSIALVLLLQRYARRSSTTRDGPPAAHVYEQQKQCPRCGEFIDLRSRRCSWCHEALDPRWHESMP